MCYRLTSTGEKIKCLEILGKKKALFAISKREIRANLTEKVTLKEKTKRRGGEAQHKVMSEETAIRTAGMSLVCVRNCKAKMLMLSGVQGGGAEEAAEQKFVDTGMP